MTALEQLWTVLYQVRSLCFVARSSAPAGWNGEGSGTVVVQATGEGVMTFAEQGTWRPLGGRDIRFTNTYRWTRAGDALRLEHLRFGVDNPVPLFDLTQTGQGEWRSASPHLCREDCYSAVLVVHGDHISLRWSIDGPRKQEEIEYTYSWHDAAS
jgi:hypothetical protein